MESFNKITKMFDFERQFSITVTVFRSKEYFQNIEIDITMLN